MTYAIFYNISDGNIFSYVLYSFEYSEDTGTELLNPPSRQHCANNNGISEASIGVKKWTVIDPQENDFVSNINDFSTGEDLVDIEYGIGE